MSTFIRDWLLYLQLSHFQLSCHLGLPRWPSYITSSRRTSCEVVSWAEYTLIWCVQTSCIHSRWLDFCRLDCLLCGSFFYWTFWKVYPLKFFFFHNFLIFLISYDISTSLSNSFFLISYLFWWVCLHWVPAHGFEECQATHPVSIYC